MQDERSKQSRQILANVTRCGNVLLRLSNLVAAQVDLSGPTWMLLAALVYAGPSGLRLGDLARHASLSAPNITARVRKLEEQGFVRRERDPDDGRAQKVFATPKAVAAMTQLEEPANDASVALFSQFSPMDLARFSDLSERLLEVLARLDTVGGQPATSLDEALERLSRNPRSS